MLEQWYATFGIGDSPEHLLLLIGLVFARTLPMLFLNPFLGGLVVPPPVKIGIAAALTVFMLLAPFNPLPHVLEKLIMLKAGNLSRPIDIFDLFYHLAPLVILIAKMSGQKRNSGDG